MIPNASLSTDTQLGGLYNNRANNVVEIRKFVFRMDVVDVEVQYIEVLLVKRNILAHPSGSSASEKEKQREKINGSGQLIWSV